ncbi:hypothetical protein WME79_45325 [Sorangium sp. So ce726]|uniref:hypothetical protein n=1 Tax=Sorangium sp. So ce726 TaxID=3133319 RepID=UPI003F639265
MVAVCCASTLGLGIGVTSGGCGNPTTYLCPWDENQGPKGTPCEVLEDPDAGGAGGCGGDGGDDCAAEDDTDVAIAHDFGDLIPAAEVCAGQCVPKEPLGWSEPTLLWIGAPDSVPSCPANAPIVGYEGYADFAAPAPHTCPACACDPPEATCEVPAEWNAYASFPCGGPEAPATSFAAPNGWDGICTSANAVEARRTCDGAPCVQSLAIQAPRVVSAGCAPRVAEAPENPDEPATAGSFVLVARACTGNASPPCPDPGMTCTPAPPSGDAAPPEGFLTCIHHEGEQDCPATYPERHVFYAGVEDTRGCAPCGCTEPAGATCSVLASAFSDPGCSQLVAGQVITSDAPYCGTVASGTALGSKSVSVVSLDPGQCEAFGGEPVGSIAPTAAATFCCYRTSAVPA